MVQDAHVVEGRDADTDSPIFPDVWAVIQVLAVERHGVEGGRQPVNRLTLAQEVEARIGLG